MDGISISLTENTHEREVSEIRVDGVIDTLTASELEEVMDSLLKRERYRIVVDLAGVDYISSAGWGILISHIKDVRAQGGDIKLAGMIPDVYEIFELLEFDNVLQALGSVEDAIASFGGTKKPADEKKKGPIVRQTVFEHTSEEATVAIENDAHRAIAHNRGDFEATVCQLVLQNPFSSVGEIRDEINARDDDLKIGWWRVLAVLRKKGLLRRKSRFRYAWGRS